MTNTASSSVARYVMGTFSFGDVPMAWTGTCRHRGDHVRRCLSPQSLITLAPVHITESKLRFEPSPCRDLSRRTASSDKSLAHWPPKDSSMSRPHSSTSVASLLQKRGMSLSPPFLNVDSTSITLPLGTCDVGSAPDSALTKSLCLLRHSATSNGLLAVVPCSKDAKSGEDGEAASPLYSAKDGTKAASLMLMSCSSSGMGGSPSRRRLSMTCARCPSAVFVSWNHRKPASLKIRSNVLSRASFPAASCE
mmetsp:Transcript_43801/g.88323  ORF Transcript_43801/g.88323 Transcript_43801/m.88323 type:complete len:250 (-) Transcript_43801:666-1415(-)